MTMQTMIRVTRGLLFVLSLSALMAALAMIVICIAGGRPDAAYPMSNMLALTGMGIGVTAIVLAMAVTPE
jgi:hypothetical protein